MPSSSSRTPPRRLAALDGLRGLAALGIVVLHVWMFDYGGSGRPDKTLLDRSIGELRIGVALFFVLSGYLIFRPFVAAAIERTDAPALGRYALRRAARILPAYWLALAVSFVVLRALGHPRVVDPAELPAFLLFQQNYDESTIRQLDPPTWTLCVEVAFYALLPLIAWLGHRWCRGRGRQVALSAAVLAAGVGLAALSVVQEWPRTMTMSLLTHLPEFAAGMLVAAAVHGRAVRHRTGVLLALGGLALVLANGWWHGYAIGAERTRELVADLPAVAGFALLVAAIATSSLRFRALTARPVQLAGTLSYGIYLLHFPVIDALRSLELMPRSLGVALAVVTAISAAAAAVSWRLVERPVLRWAHARTRRPEPRRRQPATRPSRRPATETAS